MADLSIPDEEFPVLAKIANLENDSFEAFSTALKEVPPPFGRENYVSKLALRLPSFKRSEISRMLNTIIALYRVKEKTEMPPSQIADLINEAAAESSEFGQMFEGNSGGVLKQRLTILPSLNKTLGYGTKCVLAMEDNERVCLNSEITSDLRPMFGDDEEQIKAAVINHTLQIAFKSEDERSNFYVTLDDMDLKTLKEKIEKAQQKSIQLKSFLKNSNVFYLEDE